MMELYKTLLEDAGYDVEVQPVDNRELYAPELEKGNIDVVPEYAATFAEYLNLAPTARPPSPSRPGTSRRRSPRCAPSRRRRGSRSSSRRRRPTRTPSS
jgi:hypothetical protein